MSQPSKVESPADLANARPEIQNRKGLSWPLLCLLATGLASLGLVAISLYGAPVPQLLYGHDLLILLEGAWKWKWGIVPHADYYSPLGFLTFALVALGLELGGSFANALPAAIALFAIGLLPLCLYATFTRMPPWLAAATTVVLIATVLAPHQLRFESTALTYTIIYNRWGYALLGLAFLTIIVRPFSSSRGIELVDGIVAVSCIALAISVKITYGTLALALFICWIPIQRRKLTYYVGAAAAAVFWFLIFGYLIKWAYPAFVQDMTLAFRARKGLGVAQAARAALFLYPDLCTLATLAALGCLTRSLRAAVPLGRQAVQSGLVLAFCTLSAVAIIMSNAPDGFMRESPLLSLGALVFAAGIFRDLRSGQLEPTGPLAATLVRTASASTVLLLLAFCLVGRITSGGFTGLLVLSLVATLWCVSELAGLRLPNQKFVWMRIVAATAMLIVVAPVTLRNLHGSIVAARLRFHGFKLSPEETFSSGGLAGIQIKAWGGDPPLPTTYVGKVRDGLALLAATGNSDKTVHALEFDNPFNVARGVRPSRTGLTCWQLDFVYSFKVAPPPERVFAPDEVIMLPKRFGDSNQENITALLHHYGSYLAANYRPPVESEQWQMYVPNRFGAQEGSNKAIAP